MKSQYEKVIIVRISPPNRVRNDGSFVREQCGESAEECVWRMFKGE
jgi:hypothetical protein